MSDQSFSHLDALRSVSLNGLRAFESAGRHLSFTKAAEELGVTQGAVSHQVKLLEERLGVRLFRRTPRGLMITDEGLALYPTLADSFERMGRLLGGFDRGVRKEVLTISVVGTFALGWLMSRLPRFEELSPFVDLRLLTHNNRVDVAGENLDFAVRFGDGLWNGLDASLIFPAALSPLCSSTFAGRITTPADVRTATLLRSYRGQDWLAWLAAVGLEDVPLRGPVFDSSALMAQAAMRGLGIAILPINMFETELRRGWLVQPLQVSVTTGSYWLVRSRSRARTPAMTAFETWLLSEAANTTPVL